MKHPNFSEPLVVISSMLDAAFPFQTDENDLQGQRLLLDKLHRNIQCLLVGIDGAAGGAIRCILVVVRPIHEKQH